MRNIRELRELPISEMTDEEILKAAMDRLGANCMCMLYFEDNQPFSFWRYKNGIGRVNFKKMKLGWHVFNPDCKK